MDDTGSRPEPPIGESAANEAGSDGSSQADPSARARADLDEALDTWSAMGDASILRSVASVIIGFIVLTMGAVLIDGVVISVTDRGPDDALTSGFVAMSLATRFLLAVLGGYITALTAPKAPRLHATVLAGVLIFISVASISGTMTSDQLVDPRWFPTAILFVGPIGAVVGGVLRGDRRRRRGPRGRSS